MGRAASLLDRAATGLGSRRRVALLGATLAGLAAWDAFAGHLPEIHDRWDVTLIAGLVLPATLLVVWLLLPLAPLPRLPIAAAACGAGAVLCDLAGLEAVFNDLKIVTYALVGFCFLQLFEALSWVVLVAAVVPWVDIVSVYRGPTQVVVEEQPGLFERIAVSFSLAGEDAAARLGPPDLLFAALFLATAKRFGLRVGATWVAMTALVSATLVATYAFDLDGLPALPAVALGFVGPNADLLWRAYRDSRSPDAGDGERG